MGGDVLFAGVIGRCDFPGGSQQMLVQGIAEKLMSLPDATRVLPGHGPETTIAAERSDNPYL
jgi:glyoxylase-like metal-dependent hydrolase (beta-lactamase superfamily II)